MSTLNFDALNNQNLSGMSMPEQWNSSNLFTEASLASTSYGSGQLMSLLENLEQDYSSTVPSLYNPVVSSNNNSRTPKVPSTSSVCEEDLDDEEADGILSNLPSSCQDFEAKEMHIRLERNQSSPLVAGHVSPAQSSKLSSGCQSVEPPHADTDADDLEVQWINESFEEQQKATLMYQSGDLKTLFYQGSDHESSKAPTRSSTEKSYCSPIERPERLPYVKKLLSQDSSGSLHDRPITPTHQKSEQTFQPLLTPKSDELLQAQVRKKSAIKNRRVSEPLARKPKTSWSNPDFVESLSDASTGGNEVFDSGEAAVFPLQESTRHVSFADELLVTPQARRDAESATNDQTELLAKGIVESLFVGWTPTEAVAPSFPLKQPTEANPKPLAARKLNMSGSDHPKVPPGFENVIPTPPSASILGEEADSWDTIDEDTLSRQVEKLKVTATKPLAKKPIDYFESPPTAWDPTVMPHVLEAHSIPEYKLQEDVVQALAEMDLGMAMVKWVERRIVLVSFPTEKNARDALILSKHPWLRLRSLSNAPENVQKTALQFKKVLEPPKNRPKTHVGVARRMVEGALGMKANVSQEKKLAERKELNDARASKKAAVKWDD